MNSLKHSNSFRAICFPRESYNTEVLHVVFSFKAFLKAFQRKSVVVNVGQAMSHNLEIIIDTSSP